MTGFANVEAGIEHFFEHLVADVDADLKAAIDLLMPSIKAVAMEIKTKGLSEVLPTAAKMAAAAEAAKAAGGDSSAMGKAAIAAAVAEAGALASDALHAIATAKVTEVSPAA